MNLRCAASGKLFELPDRDIALLETIARSAPQLGESSLPLPQLHPVELCRRITAYGNLTYLFRTSSALSQQPVITRYNPVLGIKVCSEEEFIDKVDNRDAGRAVDFQRSFLSQWGELFYDCLHHPRNATQCEDSEFVNGALQLKSCYLCFSSFDSRDCCYCWAIAKCSDCIDLFASTGCELCFDSVDLHGCYASQSSVQCHNCQNLFGCFSCDNCSDCIGCAGLERKKYCVFNQQLSAREYLEFRDAHRTQRRRVRAQLLEQCHAAWAASGVEPRLTTACERVSGAYLTRCEDVTESYNCSSTRQSSWLFDGKESDSCAVGMFHNCSHCFDGIAFRSMGVAYSYTVFGGSNIFYSMSMHNECADCFGCVGLQRQRYCILNRQYTKSEYEQILPRVVSLMKSHGEWGEWFPLALSPHFYHESAVDQYLEPIPLQVASYRGYRIGEEPHATAAENTVDAADLPDEFNDSDVDSLSRVSVRCVRSGRVFNLQRGELRLSLRLGIPLPQRHWRERLVDASTLRRRMPAL